MRSLHNQYRKQGRQASGGFLKEHRGRKDQREWAVATLETVSREKQEEAGPCPGPALGLLHSRFFPRVLGASLMPPEGPVPADLVVSESPPGP